MHSRKTSSGFAPLLVAAALLLTPACSLMEQVVTPQPDPGATPKSAEPTPEPTDSPVSTADSDPVTCPVPVDGSPAFTAADPLTSGEPMLTYLNSGGSIPELSSQLAEDAMIPASGIGTAQALLNPDNLLDLAILLVQPDSANLHPSGRLYVFICEEDHYRTAFTSKVEEERFNPQIHTIQDLNGDSLSEIVFSDSSCGAHTCFAATRILSWQNDGITDLMAGTTDDLPFPVFDINPEPDPPTLSVTATSIGSVGAGPFQPYRRTWEWNAESGLFEHGPDVLLPSGYRIHTLYKADDLLAAGDVSEAIRTYDQVITDDTLSDWAEPAREQAVLTAFARFRILQAHTLAGNQPEAQAAYQDLQETAPGDPGEPFAAAGEMYWSTFNETGDLVTACTSVENYAAENKAAMIDALYFGYSNRLYEPEDLCIGEPD